MKTRIGQIIDIARAGDYYRGGKHIEIAKGENQLVYTWKGFIRKLKRAIK